jgi:hypothetical protein
MKRVMANDARGTKRENRNICGLVENLRERDNCEGLGIERRIV